MISHLLFGTDQLTIKIAGSIFGDQSRAIVFASMSGLDILGSDGLLLCIRASGQEKREE